MNHEVSYQIALKACLTNRDIRWQIRDKEADLTALGPRAESRMPNLERQNEKPIAPKYSDIKSFFMWSPLVRRHLFQLPSMVCILIIIACYNS